MTTERNAQGVDGLAEVMGLLREATPGPWRFVPWHVEEGNPAVRSPEGWIIANVHSDYTAVAIVAAVNFLRSHGAAIRELVEAAMARRDSVTLKQEREANERLDAAIRPFTPEGKQG